MSTTAHVTKAEIADLLTFLAANADVANADGRPDKAEKYRQFQGTVRGLVALVGELPAQTFPTPVAAAIPDDADTHFFIDISGSVQYERIVTALMGELELVRRRAEVDGGVSIVHFTPFTHVVGAPGPRILVTEDPIARERVEHIVRQIVTSSGGTEFSEVWKHINASEVLLRQRCVIVSDMLYAAVPAQLHQQPNNLSYASFGGTETLADRYFAEALRAAGLFETTEIRQY